jgi:hypothetical protein
MQRCPECGRGGRGTLRLSAPALLTLAAREVADGEDLDEETLPQMVLLLRELRAAEQVVENRMARLTSRMVSGAQLRPVAPLRREQGGLGSVRPTTTCGRLGPANRKRSTRAARAAGAAAFPASAAGVSQGRSIVVLA